MTLLATAPPTTSTLLSCLEDLGEVDVTALSGREHEIWLRELEVAGAMLDAIRLRVVAAADSAGTGRATGAAGTSQWTARVRRIDPTTAHREVELARGLETHDATQRALRAGEISSDHAEVILRADRQLPPTTTRCQREIVEGQLIVKAQQLAPGALRQAARRVLAAIEPDPAVVDAHEDSLVAAEEADARARTRLILRDNADGTVTGHFTVPALQGHLLRKVLESMTAPRRGRLGATRAQSGDQRFDRDWDHARGEAFCELLEHLPTDHLHGKTAATVVVTVDLEQLRDRLAVAGLDTGAVISAGEARRLACSAGLIPAVLGGGSLPLDLGRLKRLGSEAQRVALGLIHSTCAADGCERPYAWCELHHWLPWSRGGPTDLANLVPLCHFHHQRVHDDAYLHELLPDGGVRFARRT